MHRLGLTEHDLIEAGRLKSVILTVDSEGYHGDEGGAGLFGMDS
jgi:hypothetical protein